MEGRRAPLSFTFSFCLLPVMLLLDSVLVRRQVMARTVVLVGSFASFRTTRLVDKAAARPNPKLVLRSSLTVNGWLRCDPCRCSLAWSCTICCQRLERTFWGKTLDLWKDEEILNRIRSRSCSEAVRVVKRRLVRAVIFQRVKSIPSWHLHVQRPRICLSPQSHCLRT